MRRRLGLVLAIAVAVVLAATELGLGVQVFGHAVWALFGPMLCRAVLDGRIGVL